MSRRAAGELARLPRAWYHDFSEFQAARSYTASCDTGWTVADDQRRERPMLDLLIRGGLVIDGSGSPRFHAATGIGDERVSIRRGDASRLRAVSASIPR